MSRSFPHKPSASSVPHDPPAAPAAPFSSVSSPPPLSPSSLPSGSAPEPRGVPPFAALRVHDSRQRLRRTLLRRRRATAAGLAVTAAALAATGAGGAVGTAADADARAEAAAGAIAAAPPRRESAPRPAKMVSAPVRIADAATVRLLRRGDRVDVIAAAASPSGPAGVADSGPEARVVAMGARVAEIPEDQGPAPEGGALIVLSVPRTTATALAGASATSRLAVTVC
jgi:hypothetical protein